MERRKALGRGLAALIPDLKTTSEPNQPHSVQNQTEAGTAKDFIRFTPHFLICSLDEIAPSPQNPRVHFDEERLSELTQSIRTQGLIQPLVVRQKNTQDSLPAAIQFVLIAGERRYRAAKQAELKEVPIVIKEVTEKQAFELALVENLQRDDLNAIEEAEAFKRLSDEFGYTQEQLAQQMGKARETIANSLRLLRLPPAVQHRVIRAEISMGHARTLLSLEKPAFMEEIATEIVEKKLSVRQTEALIRKIRQTTAPKKKTTSSSSFREFEQQLQKSLGSRVRFIEKTKERGKIEIEYQSEKELNLLIQKLTPNR